MGLKFILEQVRGARYKLSEHKYVKADQQLSSVQLYCEEYLEKKKSPQNLAKPDAYSLLADVRADLIKEYNVSKEEAGLLELSYREGLKRALQIIEEASISPNLNGIDEGVNCENGRFI